MTVTDRQDIISVISICQGTVTYPTLMPDKPLGSEDFHGRLFEAWSLWQGRHKRKLTQPALAEMLAQLSREPVSQSTVSDWFRARRKPDLESVEWLAILLGVDPGWLAFGDASNASAPGVPAAELAEPVPRGKGRGEKGA